MLKTIIMQLKCCIMRWVTSFLTYFLTYAFVYFQLRSMTNLAAFVSSLRDQSFEIKIKIDLKD